MKVFTTTLFLIVLFTQIQNLKAAAPDHYQYPALDLLDSIDLSQGATLNYDPYDMYYKIKSSNFYLSRKSLSGKLQIFDIVSQSLKYNIFSAQAYPSQQGVTLWSLPDDDSQTLGVKLNDGTYAIYNLADNQAVILQQQLNVNILSVTGIQITNDDVLLLGHNGAETLIHRYRKSLGYTEFDTVTTNFTVQTENIRTCKIDSNEYRFAIWKGHCYVQVYHCNSGGCYSMYFSNNTDCDFGTQYNTNFGDTHPLAWNQACTQVMFQSKNQGLKMVNISNNPTELTLITEMIDLKDYWFLDSYDKYIGIFFTNGTIAIYSMNLTLNRLEQYLINHYVSTFNRFNRALFYYSEEQSLFVSYFTCTNPDFPVMSEGLCINNPPVIQNNLNLNLNINISIHTNNSLNSVNITNTTVTDHQTNQTLQIPLNVTNFTIIPLSHNSTSNQTTSPLGIVSIYSYQELIASTISNSFSSIGPIIQYSVKTLQVLPFSYLFMRFINFWSICSFYLLPGIIFPNYLQSILLSIYKNVHTSLYEGIGLNLSVTMSLKQKFGTNQTSIFGLKSDFINANTQVFISLALSYLFLGLMFVLSKKLSKKSLVKSKLEKIDFKMALICQLVSELDTFFLTFIIITRHSQQENTKEKVNIILHVFFFVFSAFICCLSIILGDKKVKNKEGKEEQKRVKINMFINCYSNTIFPLSTAIDSIELFLGLNLIFLGLPIYLAFQQRNFKVNHIIQSLYMPIFHIGVVVMNFLNEKNFPQVYHHAGIIITVIAFLGAVHQILALFFGIMYDLLSQIRKKCTKVLAQTEEIETNSTTLKTKQNKFSFQIKSKQKINFSSKVQEKISQNEQNMDGKLYTSNVFKSRNQIKVIPKKAQNFRSKIGRFAKTEKKIQLKRTKTNDNIWPLKIIKNRF